jgi:hypothetical protein
MKQNKGLLIFVLIILLIVLLIKNLPIKPLLIKASGQDLVVCLNNGIVETVNGVSFDVWKNKNKIKSSSLSSPLLAQFTDEDLIEYGAGNIEEGEPRPARPMEIKESPSQAGFFGGAIGAGRVCLKMAFRALQVLILKDQIDQMIISSEIGSETYNNLLLLMAFTTTRSAYYHSQTKDLWLVGTIDGKLLVPYSVFEQLVFGTIDIKDYFGRAGFKRLVEATLASGGNMGIEYLIERDHYAPLPQTILAGQSNEQIVKDKLMLHQAIVNEKILPELYGITEEDFARLIKDIIFVRGIEKSLAEHEVEYFKSALNFKDKLEKAIELEKDRRAGEKVLRQIKDKNRYELWIKQLIPAGRRCNGPDFIKKYIPDNDQYIFWDPDGKNCRMLTRSHLKLFNKKWHGKLIRHINPPKQNISLFPYEKNPGFEPYKAP